MLHPEFLDNDSFQTSNLQCLHNSQHKKVLMGHNFFQSEKTDKFQIKKKYFIKHYEEKMFTFDSRFSEHFRSKLFLFSSIPLQKYALDSFSCSQMNSPEEVLRQIMMIMEKNEICFIVGLRLLKNYCSTSFFSMPCQKASLMD